MIPVKKEKRSERFVVFLPPSMKKALEEAERECGLDVPEFARIALKVAIDKLKHQRQN